MNKTYKTNKTDWRRLGRSILFVALLLAAGLPAGAQNNYYVITYTTGGTTYYLARNGTSGVQRVSTFDPTICIWSCSSNTAGTTASTLGTSNRYLFQVVNGTRYFLNYDLGFTATTANNNCRVRINNNLLYFYSNNRYIILSGNTPTYSTTTTTGRARADQITSSTVASISTNPTISGADVLTATGNSTYTASGAAYRFGGYTDYSFNDVHVYLDANGNTITPANATLTNAWSLTYNAYATVNSTSGVVTVSSLPESDLTLTLTVTTAVTGGTPAAPANTTLTASKVITIQGTKPSAPTITVNGTSVTLATTAIGSTSIRYTTNGTDPTTTTGTVYSSAIDLSTSATSPVTIKAITVRNGNASDVSSEVVTLTLPAPTITINGDAQTATIASSVAGATIYYTTDGSTPTTSSSQYTGNITGLAYMTTVKAIAVKDGWNNSPVASDIVTIPSGVSGGVVTLFDYEDHTWSYYKASGDLPTGYPNELHSPDPRNVKITYKGNGQYTNGNAVSGVKVGVDADAHTFVYYKTLEKGTDGKYAYTTIPNPFSVRPKNGTTYYGFSHWKVTSISGGTIDGTPTTINAETEIKFVPSGTYTTNCTSIEVVMEAVWDVAEVSTNGTFTQGYNSVERNFYVVSSSTTSNLPIVSTPCTYSSFYPNGTTDGTTAATLNNRATRRSGVSASADSKIEYIILYNNNSNTLNAAGYNFTIGRGVSGYNNGVCATTLNGLSANKTSNFKLRIESGSFTDFYFMGTSSMTSGLLTATLGCDYDRANNKDNSKLRITHDICASNGGAIGANGSIGTEIFRCTVKSGNFDLGVYGGGFQFYISSPGGQAFGKRTLIIEGGYFSDIAGGIDRNGSNNLDNINSTLVDIRIKGGECVGAVFGAAQRSASYGNRRIVITGGLFSGWIAGGANGTDNSGGQMGGTSYVYVGGNARIDSDSSRTLINRAVGGNVFAAGCGYGDGTSSGQVKVGTNIAIADDAYIERGIYGGGSFGYTTTYSNIYLMGGTIDCIGGGISANGTSYNASVKGGVYGGACQNQAGRTNVYVYGSTVNGGVYGGGNVSGDVAGPITVDIYGTDPAPSANTYAINQVFGGGNQAAYSGTPNVTVHCGTDASTPISIGEVYGGGNQASVTGTNVTIEAGNIIGDVYGGGRQAPVGNGGTSVTINGGTIRRVFGGNNISGAIASGTAGKIVVNVDKTASCPMKIGQVFGGGNQAASQVGSITVGCTGDLVTPLASGQRYGYDQEGIGAVYGGANNAAIDGDINLNIVSGIVDSVFGGNNAGGDITGDITVNIAQNAKTCSWYVGYVFGGGNNAAYSQDSDGHPEVNVSAGLVTHHVFGGGNGSRATVTGNPTVTLSGTAQVGGNVYGGGNAAPVTGNTSVKLQN